MSTGVYYRVIGNTEQRKEIIKMLENSPYIEHDNYVIFCHMKQCIVHYIRVNNLQYRTNAPQDDMIHSQFYLM